MTSSTVHPDFNDQFNMLRHGDDLIIRFRVVLIDPSYYDLEAYVDVREERPGSTPPGTDPAESFPVNTQTEVWWEEFCTNTEHYRSVNDNDTAEPEDIDVDVQGSELEFHPDEHRQHAADRAAQEPRRPRRPRLFRVRHLRRCDGGGNGAGHLQRHEQPAADAGMAGAGRHSGDRPTVYACNVGMIRAGATRNLNFQVRKNPNAVDDDLTFRADVTGEVTLSDGTPLWFPTPQARGDGVAAARQRLHGRRAARTRRRLQPDQGPARHLLREQPAAGSPSTTRCRSARNARSTSSPAAGSVSRRRATTTSRSRTCRSSTGCRTARATSRRPTRSRRATARTRSSASA